MFTEAARRNERDSEREQHQNLLGVSELEADNLCEKARRRNNLCTDPKPSRRFSVEVKKAMARTTIIKQPRRNSDWYTSSPRSVASRTSPSLITYASEPPVIRATP
tara:strand:- start:694 stop:1011 length:318 start_codon:yes stop_codon:yes gene_type:complete